MPSEDIREPIRAIWAEFWNAGIIEPADIMEQMLYLLFLRRLDDLPRAPQSRRSGLADQRLRWSTLKTLGEQELFALFAAHVFPRLRRLGGPGAAWAPPMKGARPMLPTAAALRRVVAMIDALPHPQDGAAGCAAWDYLAARLARLEARSGGHRRGPLREWQDGASAGSNSRIPLVAAVFPVTALAAP
jgi:type I restriction enzyme M protein